MVNNTNENQNKHQDKSINYNKYLDNFYQSINSYKLNDYSLNRIKNAASDLNNPQNNIKGFTIYVTGTNGKGSVIAFLRSIFIASGLTCNIFTSPHIKCLTERIVLKNQFVQKDQLNNCLLQLQNFNLSYFEQITLAAYMLFAANEADVNIIEVGIGARLDATNIIEKVDCSVITGIGFDHMEYLGETIAKIASDKAYVMRQNNICFIGKQNFTDATEQIKKHAKIINSKIHEFNLDLNHPILNLEIGLLGSHQIFNAGLAYDIALYCKNFLNITQDSIINGIKNAKWPGRIDLIKTKEYEFILDGAHNIDGTIAINKWFSQYLQYLNNSKNSSNDIKNINKIIIKNDISQLITQNKKEDQENTKKEDYINNKLPKCLIIGIKKTKELNNILKEFLHFDVIICTDIYINGLEFHKAYELKSNLMDLNYKGKIIISSDVLTSLRYAKIENLPILCAGSLFLVANVYEQLNLDIKIF